MENYEDAIQLWNMESAALIVLDENGARYSNQVGGTACSHPVAVGFLVPLMCGDVCERMEGVSHATLESCREDAQAELDSMGLDGVLELRETGERDFHEAWIHVTIKKTDHGMMPDSYAGRAAILTYPNSD